MSDKTGASRPSRGGSGVILTGLAVGAILSTPVAASAAAPVEAPAAGCLQSTVASETPVTAIREQFRKSFTAGAVAPPATDLAAIICETD